MWVQYDPNPSMGSTIDCSVRAIAKALDTDWETAYMLLSINGYLMGTVMVSNAVIASVLRQHGFRRAIVPNQCPDCYTAADFAEDHPYGTFVLGFDDHVATVVDGDIYDSWDSSMMIPTYYFYIPDEQNQLRKER